MSSSSVYQGLQSCLGPRVMEPRVLRLKLAPPGSNISPTSEPEPHEHDHKNDKKATTTTAGWSFLQAISNTSSSDKSTDEKVYVHPTVKRSSSLLSEKSLEMCTESLGSETGSNASESSDETCLFSLETNNYINTYTTSAVSRRMNRASSFPPPLTSITDFGGVHVIRPHRQDGRLILEAVASPPPHPYFHAERSDGRLRICLYDQSSFDSECDEDDDGEEGEEEVVEDNDDDDDEEEEEDVEGEMGVNKFGRPSRCKESGKRDFFGDAYFELPSLSLCL